MPARFDHLVVAIRSLGEGIAQFTRLTGVKPTEGGVHPRRGTENAVASLGPGAYVEIIAPQPKAHLSESDARMRDLDRLTIIAWAVAVDNADSALEALRAATFATTAPQHGWRVTPSGERLEWEAFKLSDARIAGAPFFIEWNETTTHPSATAPGGCALRRFRVQTPAADKLTRVLQTLGVADVTVAAGARAIEAALTCGPRPAILTGE